jgi:hypothetical protein
MKVEQRTCKYAYEQRILLEENNRIVQINVIGKSPDNFNTEKAFLCKLQLKRHLNEKND